MPRSKARLCRAGDRHRGRGGRATGRRDGGVGQVPLDAVDVSLGHVDAVELDGIELPIGQLIEERLHGFGGLPLPSPDDAQVIEAVFVQVLAYKSLGDRADGGASFPGIGPQLGSRIPGRSAPGSGGGFR